MAISLRWLYLGRQYLKKMTDSSLFRDVVAREKGPFRLPHAGPAEIETITPVSEAPRHACFFQSWLKAPGQL